jgi:hypothetical protein
MGIAWSEIEERLPPGDAVEVGTLRDRRSEAMAVRTSPRETQHWLKASGRSASWLQSGRIDPSD